jgi:alkylation response protein AidB-like acyl-CoA dehydrogenase
MTPVADPVTERAVHVLRTQIALRAGAMDADKEALREGLQILADHQFLALRRPEAYGGPALDELAFRQFQEEVARASGALAFLQTQHQSAVGMIAKSAPAEFCARTLPRMHNGELMVAIAFSQLRRSGAPLLTATPDPQGGYRLNGHMPWVTGFGFFHQVLVGAQLPSGESVFGLLPFENSDAGGGTLRYSEPMRLAAMESAQTVTGDLVNWPLTSTDTAFIQPEGWIQRNDMVNVTLQAWFALGCARAGLDLVLRAHEQNPQEFLLHAFSTLSAEREACREAALDQSRPEEERIEVRAWAIDLAVRCAQAGVAASRGAANVADHDAQRIYREALVYTVSAQTTAIMAATLDRLVRRGQTV